MRLNRVLAIASVLALGLGGMAFAAETGAAAGPNRSEPATHAQANMDESNDVQASTNDIKQAQQSLKDEGLYNGAIDGQWGPETRQAVAKFQKKNGLKQTAQLDEQTLDQLQQAGNDSQNDNGANQNDNAPNQNQ